MFAAMDERWIWGVDLSEVDAVRLKERVAGAVWSRTVMVVPIDQVAPHELEAAREHFGRWGTTYARAPGEAHRRNCVLRDRPDQKRLTINLISHDNGVGLTQDVRLLRGLFEGQGHEVEFAEWRNATRQADVNFHIELFDPKHLQTARSHVGLFNLEWFDKAQLSSLGSMSQLWAKSQEALQIYERAGHGLWPAHYTGFLSRDVDRPQVAKERTCIHVRGKASQKNTILVFETWRRHGDRLPRLIVTSADECDGWRRTHPSAEMVFGYQTEEQLAVLMNRSRFHVCPSETEGWGHYIAEALSCRSVVVTTDGSPMNEHVRPEHGALIGTHPWEAGLVMRHGFEPDALAEAILALEAKDDADLDEMGARARSHWEGRQADFQARALSLLSNL